MFLLECLSILLEQSDKEKSKCKYRTRISTYLQGLLQKRCLCGFHFDKLDLVILGIDGARKLLSGLLVNVVVFLV